MSDLLANKLFCSLDKSKVIVTINGVNIVCKKKDQIVQVNTPDYAG